MIPQPLDLARHPPLPHHAPKKPLLDERLREPAEGVRGGRDTDEDQTDIEDAPGGVQRTHFVVADRREGDRGHEERVEQRPTLDHHESNRADDEDECEQQQAVPDVADASRERAGIGIHLGVTPNSRMAETSPLPLHRDGEGCLA